MTQNEKANALLKELAALMENGEVSPFEVIKTTSNAATSALRQQAFRPKGEADPHAPQIVVSNVTTMVAIYPQGGGFQRIVPLETFEQDFAEIPREQQTPPFYPGAACLDDGQSYPCFLNGTYWNGWACPMFTEDVAHQIAADINAPPETDLRLGFNPEKDAFIEQVDGCPEEEWIAYAAETIEVAGQSIKVYPVGNGSWCWDESEPAPAEPAKRTSGMSM